MKSLKSLRLTVLFVLAITVAVCFNFLSTLKFDYDIESFLNQEDKTVQFYHEHKDRFENDNNFLLIGISHNKNVFELDFMRKIHELSDELKLNNAILSVTSPTTIKEKAFTSVGPVSYPLINLDNQEYLDINKKNVESSSEYFTDLFSSDKKSILIHLTIEEPVDYESGQVLLNEIKTTVNKKDFIAVNYGGRINTREYYVKNISKQSITFAIISIILLISFLYYSFRSILGVLLPLVVLIISIIFSLSIVNYSIGKLDIMLSMLPTIVFVVGVSYSIHILSFYAEEYKKSQNKFTAIILAVKKIWSTIAITVFTTSFGFLSLYLIQIKPIQNFAIYNAIAILITGVISIVILPILVSLFNPKYIFKNTAIVASTGQSHGLFLNRVLTKSKLIQGFSAVVILLFIWGTSQINTNNNFLDDLSKQSELGKELSFFESNFGGIRPFEMSVNNNGQNILSYENILNMEIIHNYLENTYKVSGLISPVTIIKAANKSFNSGLSENYVIPKDQKSFKALIAKMNKKKVFRKYTNVISKDFSFGRFYGRNLDYGSQIFRRKNIELNNFLLLNGLNNNYQLTGSAELMDATNGEIASKLLMGIGLGILVVTILIAFIFGSIRIALISILPNIIPVIVVGGFMGFLGIDLKVATAMAFTIIFGIAVDDTIHLMKRVKGELKQNYEMSLAIKNTYQSTGKAVVLTSLIISAGFLAFITSEFTGLFYFGILISVGILSALIADYILLPLLLLKLKPKRFIKQKI